MSWKLRNKNSKYKRQSFSENEKKKLYVSAFYDTIFPEEINNQTATGIPGPVVFWKIKNFKYITFSEVFPSPWFRLIKYAVVHFETSTIFLGKEIARSHKPFSKIIYNLPQFLIF